MAGTKEGFLALGTDKVLHMPGLTQGMNNPLFYRTPENIKTSILVQLQTLQNPVYFGCELVEINLNRVDH